MLLKALALSYEKVVQPSWKPSVAVNAMIFTFGHGNAVLAPVLEAVCHFLAVLAAEHDTNDPPEDIRAHNRPRLLSQSGEIGVRV